MTKKPYYTSEKDIAANRLKSQEWRNKKKELGELVTLAFNIHPDQKNKFVEWCNANNYGNKEGFLKLISANFTRYEIEKKIEDDN